jgi:hypothetical protein
MYLTPANVPYISKLMRTYIIPRWFKALKLCMRSYSVAAMLPFCVILASSKPRKLSAPWTSLCQTCTSYLGNVPLLTSFHATGIIPFLSHRSYHL